MIITETTNGPAAFTWNRPINFVAGSLSAECTGAGGNGATSGDPVAGGGGGGGGYSSIDGANPGETEEVSVPGPGDQLPCSFGALAVALSGEHGGNPGGGAGGTTIGAIGDVTHGGAPGGTAGSGATSDPGAGGGGSSASAAGGGNAGGNHFLTEGGAGGAAPAGGGNGGAGGNGTNSGGVVGDPGAPGSDPGGGGGGGGWGSGDPKATGGAGGAGRQQRMYAVKPWPTSVTPANGPLTGGTAVVIEGINFDEVAHVFFGGVPALSWSLIDAEHLSAETPPGSGIVNVTLMDADGTGVLVGGFTYGSPAPAPVSVLSTLAKKKRRLFVR